MAAFERGKRKEEEGASKKQPAYAPTAGGTGCEIIKAI
jgi:hypothetical protein